MATEEDGLPASTVREIETFLDEWLVDENVPGASVAVVDDESVLYANGLGARDTGSGSPATPDTLYGVGSIAKPVTAIAVLQLVDRDEISLDDAVSDHIPVLQEAPGDPITVGELLSHSSGIPRDFVAVRENVVDRENLFRHVDRAAAHRLTDEDRYMYSNGGFLVLGELVAAVDGRDFGEYARQEIFTPLGMHRSTFDPEVLDEDADAMTGYVSRDGDLTPGDVTPAEFEQAGASGGLVSSVSDLARLLRCVMNQGVLDGTRVLAADRVEAMCERQSPPLATADGTRRGYGYGWEVGEFMGEPLVGHRGGIFVSGGYVGVLPGRDLGVALAFNRTGQPVVSTGRAVLALACGERPEEVVRAIAARETVAAVTGTYDAHAGDATATVEAATPGTIEVRLDGMDLEFTAAPASTAPDEYVFASDTGNGLRRTVEFRESESATELLVSLGKWSTLYRRETDLNGS